MREKKIRDIFVEGPISPALIATSIEQHNNKFTIGGHSIFLGQVRADEIDGKMVAAIDYTSNKSMVLELMAIIREEIFEKYPLTCMHIFHSLGRINTGELCIFVFTSAPHRKAAIDACEETVERIKTELPIWGKEIFEDATHQWKVNK